MQENLRIIQNDLVVDSIKLHQWLTNAYWLEGVPRRKGNEANLAAFAQDVARSISLPAIHVIEPERRPYTNSAGIVRTEYYFLPPVICVAELRSLNSFRDPSKDYACLGVAWFQSRYALPVDAGITEKSRQFLFVICVRSTVFRIDEERLNFAGKNRNLYDDAI